MLLDKMTSLKTNGKIDVNAGTVLWCKSDDIGECRVGADKVDDCSQIH